MSLTAWALSFVASLVIATAGVGLTLRALVRKLRHVD